MKEIFLMRKVYQVYEDYYIYKELARQQQDSLGSSRSNTLLHIINKLTWLKEERQKLGYKCIEIQMCIDIIKEMLE
jgi:hypothetical protein